MVDIPKIHEQPIIRLDPNEIVDILNICEKLEGAYSASEKIQ